MLLQVRVEGQVARLDTRPAQLKRTTTLPFPDSKDSKGSSSKSGGGPGKPALEARSRDSQRLLADRRLAGGPAASYPSYGEGARGAGSSYYGGGTNALGNAYGVLDDRGLNSYGSNALGGAYGTAGSSYGGGGTLVDKSGGGTFGNSYQDKSGGGGFGSSYQGDMWGNRQGKSGSKDGKDSGKSSGSKDGKESSNRALNVQKTTGLMYICYLHAFLYWRCAF